jgi:hypothetical protein
LALLLQLEAELGAAKTKRNWEAAKTIFRRLEGVKAQVDLEKKAEQTMGLDDANNQLVVAGNRSAEERRNRSAERAEIVSVYEQKARTTPRVSSEAGDRPGAVSIAGIGTDYDAQVATDDVPRVGDATLRGADEGEQLPVAKLIDLVANAKGDIDIPALETSHESESSEPPNGSLSSDVTRLPSPDRRIFDTKPPEALQTDGDSSSSSLGCPLSTMLIATMLVPTFDPSKVESEPIKIEASN